VKDLSRRILQDSRLKQCSKKDRVPSSVHGADWQEKHQKQQPEAKLSRSGPVPTSISRDHLEAMKKKEQERREVEASITAAMTSPRIQALEKSLSKSKMRSKKNRNPSKAHSEAATSRKKLDMEVSSKPGLENRYESTAMSKTTAPLLRPATSHLVDSGIHQLSDCGAATIPDPPPSHSPLLPGAIPNLKPAAISSTWPHFSPGNGSIAPQTYHHSSSSSESPPAVEADGHAHKISSKPEKKHSPAMAMDVGTSYLQVKDLPRAHEILAKEVTVRCLLIQIV